MIVVTTLRKQGKKRKTKTSCRLSKEKRTLKEIYTYVTRRMLQFSFQNL